MLVRKVEATFPCDYAMKEPSLWINRAQALLPLSGVSSSSLTFVMFLGTQVIVAPFCNVSWDSSDCCPSVLHSLHH